MTARPLVRERYPQIPRRVSGYNLDELLPERGFNLARAIVGSEGTLAVVLKATVRVVPKPRRLALVVLGFDDVFSRRRSDAVAAEPSPGSARRLRRSSAGICPAKGLERRADAARRPRLSDHRTRRCE